MSRKSSKGNNKQSNSNTAVKLATVPPANPAIVQQMAQQWGNTTYGPNAPLLPYPGLQPANGPRTWQYPIANNLNLVVRDNLTPFEILRQFANLYDVIGLCLQVWFDCAANLELDIVPVDGLLGKNETADKYASDIARYKEFFESPDKEHTLHEWLNAILRDLATIDAVCIYPELTYGGDLNALILIDGSTIKPLLDDRGRTPQPPFYAYEQIVYGAPSEMWTTDDLLYLKEHHRTNSMFGFSRVENIIMRVNQALRKQNLDMSMFTDGNVPAGFISPAADVGWSPEQLMTYQTMFDSLLAGNDAMRSRVKTLPPGGAYVPTNPMVFSSDLDVYTLKVTHASFGVMPSQSGFTDDVNKATAESQGDITYQRTLKPISNRIAKLITYVMNRYMNEKRFKAVFKGYEAQEDFAANATSHVALVGAGIENVNDAARALKLPAEGKEVPRFIVTKTGPFVIDDLANVAVRAAQVEALTQATTQTANDSEAGPATGGNVVDGSGASGPASESSPKSGGKQQEDDKATGNAAKDKTVKRSAGDEDDKEEAEQHTGVMVAFFLDAKSAKELALPKGEPVEDLHVTLAFLGDKSELTGDVKQLQSALASFAERSKPLEGRVSGVGRFTPSEHSDNLSPVIAMVDVQGLHQFRDELVQHLEQAGFKVANDFAYTPHITLVYVDATAPMPVKSVPDVSLNFDSIWLASGDDRTEYKMGTGGSDEDKKDSKSKDVVRMARADLAKWRNFAVARIESGKPLRAFVSSDIPSGLIERIQRALEDCTTADEARLVFAGVQDQQITETDDDNPFLPAPSTEGQLERYNENHDANGRFGTGGGGGSGSGGNGGNSPVAAGGTPVGDLTLNAQSFQNATLTQFGNADTNMYPTYKTTINGQEYFVKQIPANDPALGAEILGRQLAVQGGLADRSLPITVMQKDGNTYVVQPWIGNGKPLCAVPNEKITGLLNSMSTPDLTLMQMHEYLTNDFDRHAGNYMVDKTAGKLLEMDFGLTGQQPPAGEIMDYFGVAHTTDLNSYSILTSHLLSTNAPLSSSTIKTYSAQLDTMIGQIKSSGVYSPSVIQQFEQRAQAIRQLSTKRSPTIGTLQKIASNAYQFGG